MMNAVSLEQAATLNPPRISPLQLFYWLLRRELWENRSLYIAPLAVGLLIILATAVSVFQLPGRVNLLNPAEQHDIIEQPYMLASLLLMFTNVVVALYFCLEAFQGERRDRSILFWKSMPVSDFSTVAAKAAIPLLAIPLMTFAVTAATQVVMLLLGSLRPAPDGTAIWHHVPLLQMWPLLLYHLVAGHGLWYAPFYGWLLLVSAWARRAPLLWAVLPLLVLALVEKIALNTSYFAALLLSRFAAAPQTAGAASNPMSMHSLVQSPPGQFLTSPGLWLGLGFFALCLAYAVRFRRRGIAA